MGETKTARQQIFENIRKSKARGGIQSEPEIVQKRLTDHPMGIIPQRSQLEHHEQVTLFQEMAEKVQATVQKLEKLSDIPEAVAEYLKQRNLPARLKVADHSMIKSLSWTENTSHMEILHGASQGDDLVSLSVSFAGIAETGTLMMLSGPEGPVTLNFLPETHIVVLREKDIVGTYEEAWQQVRKVQKSQGQEFLPRAVNMITGPSRTGDIEQTILLGAHGPHAVHILIINDDEK